MRTHRQTTGQTDIQVDPSPAARRRRRRRRVLLAVGVCLVLCLGLSAGGAWYLNHKVTSQIERIPDVFTGLTHRPVKPPVGTAKKATNILVIGTDRRSEDKTTGEDATAPTWLPGAQRSDTLMLVHISGDRDNVTVVSIPRDSWVRVPGHGSAKINAGFSFGGPSLAIRTVEELTGVRIDHLAVVDWDGFKAMIDSLGPIEVTIEDTVHDSARDKTWTAGRHRLDGEAALQFVRQRYGLPGGDLDRVRRQQLVLRAILTKALAQDLWADPIGRYRVLDAVTSNLSLDDGWAIGQVRHLLRQISEVERDNFFFTTAPVRGAGRVGQQSVVFLDDVAGARLWRTVNEDRAPEWFAAHPETLLPHTPIR
ncbi:LCP family protein required for cell wall assembly [Nocardioides daedukensis]|uniref:LCP family protein required for cell wall assembly n=1 Tax=Nocardioides daedukensis TaxID=634462 RepID=A0A7Y9S0V7_9ACTN|nr:LCP family protein [Nocardioides daedukensis]NYG60262.1 LCP family protein required for cell wall assembly [Nocardioides daedukensis]